MKVLSSLAVMAGAQYGIEVAQVEELLGGLIFGLIEKDDLKEIETCMTDTDKVVEQVNEAVGDLMKEDVKDIINGVQILATIAAELPEDVKDCKGMEADATKLSNWAKGLAADPAKTASMVATNVIKNFSGILDDINKSSSDISSGDYYTAGTDIADVVVLVVGKPDDAQDPESLQVTGW